MELGDADLLSRWQRGDSVAGEALIRRYYEPVERFFANKIAGDASDLVQETFIACIRGRTRIDDSNKFRSYLFSIAYNVLRAYFRKQRRKGGDINWEELSAHDLSAPAGPSMIVARREEERLLLQALRCIPLEYQVVLELRYWEDFTMEEIAAILQVPLGTVKSRLSRAHKELTTRIEALAGSPELLQSTVTRLDDWVARCRSLIAGLALKDA